MTTLTEAQASELARLRVARREAHEREYHALLSDLAASDGELSDEQCAKAEWLCEATGRTAASLASDLTAAGHAESELRIACTAHNAVLKHFDRTMRQHR